MQIEFTRKLVEDDLTLRVLVGRNLLTGCQCESDGVWFALEQRRPPVPVEVRQIDPFDAVAHALGSVAT